MLFVFTQSVSLSSAFLFFPAPLNSLQSFSAFSLGMSPLSKHDGVITPGETKTEAKKLLDLHEGGGKASPKARREIPWTPGCCWYQGFVLPRVPSEADEVEVPMPPCGQRLPLPGRNSYKEPGCFPCSSACIPHSLLRRDGDEWEERGSEWTLFSNPSRC